MLIFCDTQAQNILQFDNGIDLQITIVDFKAENHRIDTCLMKNQPYICTIDELNWYGMDLGMELPKYELKEVVVLFEGNTISLDVTQMYNPTFNEARLKRQFEVNIENGQIEINAWFSDGAGTYCAKWTIKNGSSKREILKDCF